MTRGERGIHPFEKSREQRVVFVAEILEVDVDALKLVCESPVSQLPDDVVLRAGLC